MARASRRLSLRTQACMIGGITLSIILGVALFGWFAGWHAIHQYSIALRITGAVAGVVGVLSLGGNQTWGADRHFGAASLEIGHYQTRGQPDHFHDVNRSFAFLVMMAVVGFLVAGSGVVLQWLLG